MVDDEAPDRKCIILEFRLPILCTQNQVDAQIVLYESTNAIEIYIGQRPSCDWGSVCTGIQDDSNTMGAHPNDLPTDCEYLKGPGGINNLYKYRK